MRPAALAAALIGAALAHAPAAPARPAPARLLVEAREFSLVLSRQAVRHGDAIVQLVNRGEDGHDLHLVRLGPHGRSASRPRGTRETRPGAVSSWRGTLTAGRYKLFCSIPGHERQGMRAALRVR
jgi:plastocyanin